MPPRSSWKGFLKLSLINVPVKAYTAAESSGGTIRLNQLHRECNSRIKYQKACPVHGEVGADEIVSGYEFAKDQYVVIDPDEIDKLRSESDKAINIDTFVDASTVDPIYHSGKTMYLVPDGPVGHKPYTLVLQALEEEQKQAVARVVMHGKEQLVLLRPIDGVLGMTMLNYETQVKKPSIFATEVPDVDVNKEELKLIKTLIETSSKEEFDLSEYKDIYTERLSALVDAKVAGEELVAAPSSSEPEVINLMEALKQSVAKAQGDSPKPAAKKAASKKKPEKKMATSKKAKKATRKKKIS